MKNAVTWFEIGTANLAKAIAFYKAVLGQNAAKKTWSYEKAGLAPKEKCLPMRWISTSPSD